jgi:hypothetical protein
MKTALAPFGIASVVLGLLVQGAEAKKVDYEIDGQRYSYESTNRQQVEVARKRIEAANAAKAAKARADAKRASDPFAAIFGSQADQEAEQAQASLKRLIAEQEQAAAEAKRRQQSASKNTQRPEAASAGEKEPEAVSDGQAGAQIASAGPSKPIDAGSAENPTPIQPRLRSVSFDFESGIKTTVMGDGALHEEPFDPAALSSFISENGSLTKAVDRNRNEVEITGSTPRVTSQ